MNEPITPQSAALTPGNTLTFWPRFRATFGPAAVGLIGGALTVGVAFVSMPPILRAVGETYAKFPSINAPWLAGDFTLPVAVSVPLFFLAVAAPFVMGLVSARLARPKDGWEAVSAGLTTAAAASATAYLLWIGWMVTMATVVVPSISDMTLFANSTRTPAGAASHPSDVMTDPYPDLKTTPADQRGELLFPKIVSDQVVGSASGVWLGVIMSVAAVGLPGLCGTLAGSWLLRRGGSWCSTLFSYLEITVATSVPLATLVLAAVSVGFAFAPVPHLLWLRFAALSAVSAVVVCGVVYQYGWPLRFVAAFVWVMVLMGVGFRVTTSHSLIGTSFLDHLWKPSTIAAVVGYGGLALLLIRKNFLRTNAQVPSATRFVMPA